MKLKSFYILLIILIISTYGCKVNSSMKQTYASYFVDNNVYLYFIKPLKLKNNNIEALIDFTFKDSSLNSNSGVICNFTLYNHTFEKNDEVYFVENSKKVKLQNTTILYSEVKNNKLITRFTSSLSSKVLLEALEKKAFHLIVKNNSLNTEFVCILSDKSSKRWNKTHNSIFQTLNIKKSQ
jgi:hypothetical protein